MDGLRERRKQRTRKALSDAAAAMFAERGFDRVTISEIAAAAEVAVGTVFNYFRTKEELFFDREEQLTAGLIQAVSGSDDPIPAFRAWHESELDFLLDPRAAGLTLRFFRTIAESQTLPDAELRLHRRLEAALSEALGEPILAALLLAAHRSVLELARADVLAGRPPRRATEAAFAMLAQGSRKPTASA